MAGATVPVGPGQKTLYPRGAFLTRVRATWSAYCSVLLRAGETTVFDTQPGYWAGVEIVMSKYSCMMNASRRLLQRAGALKNRRFSMFNTHPWIDSASSTAMILSCPAESLVQSGVNIRTSDKRQPSFCSPLTS